ncbi:MAG: sugar ABC transporter permease, partial [Armatimonadota bacterium]
MKRSPWIAIGFLAPAVLLYAVFVVGPLGQTAWFSLFQWRGVSVHRTFVGPENYIKLFNEDAYRKALFNMAIFLFLAVPVLMGFGVGVAHWLNGGSWLSKASRKVYLLPHVLSIVVVAILWQFLYSPSFGLVN